MLAGSIAMLVGSLLILWRESSVAEGLFAITRLRYDASRVE